MRKGLPVCLILCGLPLSAVAGERSGAILKNRILANVSKPLGALRRDAPAPLGTTPQRFMLPAGTARLQPLPRVTVLAERGPRRAGNGAAPAAWGPGSTLPEVTARAGGSYAVYDVMRDQPRPRHRKSPLSTALVLRLDGKDDSPSFSVGGGGVAAAVWRAVPK
ncbi:MAG: hypothetical protein MT490_17325 [Sphingomonas sp.]|uniref:hypothetical protein n=1 Tax=Sphingomonas sp. TaxID=28214 RepID=UPI002276C9BD|nr:hypothetical protein [Sphingomonas sp.]MCX8477553.1 hypothetical protein [Sphingomonas sp.]